MAHRRTSSTSSQRSSGGVVLTPTSSAAPSRRNSQTGSGSSSAVTLAFQASRRNSPTLSSPNSGSTFPILAQLPNAPYSGGGKAHPDRHRGPWRAAQKRDPLKASLDPRYRLRCPFRHNEQLLRSVLPEGKGLGKALTTAEKHILHRLRQAANEIKKTKGPIPIILFTDIGKDRDDILALMALSVLHKLKIFDLMLVVVNIYPVALRASFTRGVLDSLGLYNVPVAVGSDKPLDNVNNVKYYYEDKYERMPKQQYNYPRASTEVPNTLRAIIAAKKKARVITIGTLRDVYEIANAAPQLFGAAVEQVHAQGGHKWTTKEASFHWTVERAPKLPSAWHKSSEHCELVPSEDATNNMNDWKAAMNWHKYLQYSKMPFVSYTKISTFSAPPPQSIFDDLPRNELALTRYLRYLNVEQSWVFYWCTLYAPRRIRPAFDEIFYFTFLTTWPRDARMEPDPADPTRQKKVLYWMGVDKNPDKSTWTKDPPRPIDEALRPDRLPANAYEAVKPAPPSFMKFFAPIMKMTAYDVIAVCGCAGPEIANILGVRAPDPASLPDHAGIVGESFSNTGMDKDLHPVALMALLKEALLKSPKQS